MFSQTLFTKKALQVIETQTKDEPDRPWFVYLSWNLPHVASWSTDPDGKQVKVAPFMGRCEKNLNTYNGIRKEECRHRSQLENYIDVDVGVLVKKIEQLGITENTLIIFGGDNGPEEKGIKGGRLVHDKNTFKSTAGMRGAKREVFEGGIRSPILMSWPGTLEKDLKTNELFSLTDLFATIAELANITELMPTTLDSKSLAPTLLGKPEEQISHEYLYFEYCDQQARNWATIKSDPDALCSWALIKDEWKLMFVAETQTRFLFNLNDDPFESNNIYSTYPVKAAELEALRDEEAHIPLQDIGYDGQTQ